MARVIDRGFRRPRSRTWWFASALVVASWAATIAIPAQPIVEADVVRVAGNREFAVVVNEPRIWNVRDFVVTRIVQPLRTTARTGGVEDVSWADPRQIMSLSACGAGEVAPPERALSGLGVKAQFVRRTWWGSRRVLQLERLSLPSGWSSGQLGCLVLNRYGGRVDVVNVNAWRVEMPVPPMTQSVRITQILLPSILTATENERSFNITVVNDSAVTGPGSEARVVDVVLPPLPDGVTVQLLEAPDGPPEGRVPPGGSGTFILQVTVDVPRVEATRWVLVPSLLVEIDGQDYVADGPVLDLTVSRVRR